MAKKTLEFQTITKPLFKPELIVPSGYHVRIHTACFSPDGEYILTGDWGTLKLWNIESATEIRSFKGNMHIAHRVCFSPDGRTVLSASQDVTLKLWDILTGAEIRYFGDLKKFIYMLDGHAEVYNSICFSPDGRYALSGSQDRKIKLWHIQTGIEIRSFTGHKDAVRSVCFSTDGNYVFSRSYEGTIKLWNIQTGREIISLKGLKGGVFSACFSPNGRQALLGNGNRKIKLLDIATGRKIRSLKGHKGGVCSVCFSPDGGYALSGSKDKTIKLWDVFTGEEIRSFEGHTDAVSSIRFSLDGNYALSKSGDKTIKLWDISTGKMIRSFEEGWDAVKKAIFSPDSRRILSFSGDCNHKLWDIQSGQELPLFGKLTSTKTKIYFSPDGQYGLLGLNDGKLQLWDIVSGKVVKSFEGHVKQVSRACFSSDSKYIAASDGVTLKLWDIMNGQIVHSFDGISSSIWAICFLPDGNHVLTGSEDGFLKLWNIQTGQNYQIQENVSHVRSICSSLDGLHALVLNGPYDATLSLWEISTGNKLCSFYGDHANANCVCFSPGGDKALAGDGAGFLSLWDIHTGEGISSIEGKIPGIVSICFSPDGNKAMAGSMHGGLILWELNNNKTVCTLEGHTGRVNSVWISQDGRCGMSGSDDNCIKFWDIITGKEIATRIGLDSDDWVITTPSGLFDASEAALTKIHYTIGLETIGFDQLVGMYHIPGLLRFLLSDSKERLPEVPPIENIRLHPSMEANIENDNLIIALENRGGGIGRVMVYVENIEFIADARKEPPKDQCQERLTIRIDLIAYQKFFIPARPNRLTVFSENENGTLRSKPIHLDYSPDILVSKGGGQSETATQPLQKEADRPLKMYAVFIGSNSQGSSKDKLKYAARDANEMASVAKAAGQELYGEKNMVISVFSGENLSKKEIVEEFNRMQELTTEDVVMIFLSGHGTTKGDFKEYYYLLKDWDPVESIETIIATPWMREICTLSIRELQEMVNSIPARKRILILDTCQSGSISGHFSGAKSIVIESYSQIKVIGEVRRSTGFCILSGCAVDNKSFEYEAYRHGLMTYAILLGISTGEGLLEKDGKQYIEPLKLFNYVKAKTENLANSLNHTQKPELSIPESLAGDFFLGEVTPEQKQAIKLTELKMFTWSSINPIKPKDELELSQKMDQFLDKCAKRGELVYTEREDNPDVYQIVGNYRLVNEFIMIDSWIKRGGKFVQGSEKEIKCKAFEVDKVAWEIFRVLHTS